MNPDLQVHDAPLTPTLSRQAKRGSALCAEITFSLDTGEKPVNETYELGRVIVLTLAFFS